MGDLDTLGKRVKFARERAKKSLEAVAEDIGIRYQSIQDIEKGDSRRTVHLLKLARSLGVRPEWLESGDEPMDAEDGVMVPIVGDVGAGQMVIPFDDYPLGQGFDLVPAPPGEASGCVAARIRGESQYPLQDGWLIFYRRDIEGVPAEAIGKLCVVKISDGRMMLKYVRRGSKKNRWNLQSWNAEPMEDVMLEWASKVRDIRPT